MQDHLQTVLESNKIRELLANYCIWLDEGNIAAVAQCFSHDATADYGPGRGGVIVGPKAIGERIAAGQSVFRRTHHQLGQTRLDLAGQEAAALTYVTAWHERFTGEQEILCLRYIDQLRKDDAVWSIAARRVEAAFAQGFPGTAWNWVHRAGP